MIFIYKIINTHPEGSNKIYIGQTWKTIKKRWNEHCWKNSKCIKLKYAIEKYGKDNFIIEEIYQCDAQKDADEKEIFYINLFDSIKNGYNITEGGRGGSRGRIVTEKTKNKMSISHKGHKVSEETKLKISVSHIGIKPNNKTKNKMSLAKQGKHISQATEFKKGQPSVNKKNFNKEQIQDILLLKVKIAAIKYNVSSFVIKRIRRENKCL